jgi:hypothetical protein
MASLPAGALSPDCHTNEGSPLLRLPRELRDHIYSLALTQPNNTLKFVVARKNDPQSASETSSKEVQIRESKNQLQYVCKQMYHETQWLELKVNTTLEFRSEVNAKMSATDRFIGFLSAVPAPKLKRIQTVELYSGVFASVEEFEQAHEPPIHDSKETLLHLADVCRSIPSITVKYRLTAFSRELLTPKTPLRIAYTGYLYIVLLRTMHSLHPAGPGEAKTLLAGFVDDWGDYANSAVNQHRRDARRLRMPNLKFFPMEDISIEGAVDNRFMLRGRNVVPTNETVVWRWMKNGF